MATRRKLSFKELSMEFAVGLFFFGALVLLGFFTIVVNRNKLAGETGTMAVRFASVTSLAAGDPVLVRGVQVGRVKALELVPAEVRVTLGLDQSFDMYEGYLIEVRHSSVLGGRLVYIEPGKDSVEKPRGPLPGDMVFVGSAPVDIMNETARMVQAIREEVDYIKTAIREGDFVSKAVQLVDNLEVVSRELKEGRGTLGQLIKDDGLHRRMLESFGALERAGQRLETTGEKFSGLVDDVKSGQGTLGKLLTDDAVYRELSASTLEFKGLITDLRAGKGTLGKLLTDEQLHQDFAAMSRNLSAVSARLERGESTMGKFFSDDGVVYDELRLAVKDLRHAVRSVAESEGTLGRLLHDDEMYREAMETVREIRQAVEDFREQAPVSTFGGLIFGAL